jgi:hypothetical protein
MTATPATYRAGWKMQGSAALFGAAGAFALSGLLTSGSTLILGAVDQYAWMKLFYSLGLWRDQAFAGMIPPPLIVELPMYLASGLCLMLGLVFRFWPTPHRPKKQPALPTTHNPRSTTRQRRP